MKASQATSNQSQRLLIFTLYFAILVWGVVQVIRPASGAMHYLSLFIITSTAACWAVFDARNRGRPILHIVQSLIFLCWPVAVPLYLIRSRGIHGLGLVFLHFFGLALVLCVGFYATAITLYSLGAFSN